MSAVPISGPFVTVALCTWNRAALLPRALDALVMQKLPVGASWELLVVDNASTDSTPAVLDSYRHRLPLRVVREPVQGIAHARNRAVAQARGAWLLWTDDDIRPGPDWIAQYLRAIAAHPGAALLGGPVLAEFEAEPQAWVRQAMPLLAGVFGLCDLGADPQPLRRGALPFGGNYAVRAEVQRRYPYHPLLGHAGATLRLHEETYLFQRLLADGHGGQWVPQAQAWHWVGRARQTRAAVRAYYLGLGASDAVLGALTGKPAPPARRLAVRWLRASLRYLAARLRGDGVQALTHLSKLWRARGELAARRQARGVRMGAAARSASLP